MLEGALDDGGLHRIICINQWHQDSCVVTIRQVVASYQFGKTGRILGIVASVITEYCRRIVGERSRLYIITGSIEQTFGYDPSNYVRHISAVWSLKQN